MTIYLMLSTDDADKEQEELEEDIQVEMEEEEEEEQKEQRDWRISEDGSLKKNKNKLYKSETLTRFPKKPTYYFVEEKSKSTSN